MTMRKIFLLVCVFLIANPAFAKADTSSSKIIEGEVIELDKTEINEPLEGMLEETNEPIKSGISKYYTFDQGLLKIKINDYMKFDFGLIGDVTWLVNHQKDDLHTKYFFPSIDFLMSGEFNDYLDYKVQIYGNENINEGTILGDVWVRGKYKNYTTTVGRMRKSFTEQGMVSTYDIDFATRAQAIRLLNGNRDTGIKLNGAYKYADVDLGLYANMQNWPFRFRHKGVEFDGKIALKPLADNPELGKLRLGGGIATGHRDNTYANYNGFLTYDYKKFGLKSEYIYLEPTYYNEKRANGYYVAGTYFLTDKLQAAARFDTIDYKNSPDINEYTAGLNYYLNGPNTMFVVNYTFIDGEVNSSRVALQMRYKTW